jgi:diguanylate cyclase (GGDEF)-like protein
LERPHRLLFRNLKKSESELGKALEEVQRLAITDSLTGLYNRRHFFELAEHELQRARRYRRSLSAIMLDIDHFKQVNDTYGHAVGDHVLKEVADSCRQAMRKEDVLGRYGGEEFVIMMPESNLVATCQVAERLRQSIAQKTIDTEVGPVMVTVSLGVITLDDECSTLETLLAGADQALYWAKRSGRNRVGKS